MSDSIVTLGTNPRKNTRRKRKGCINSSEKNGYITDRTGMAHN